MTLKELLTTLETGGYIAGKAAKRVKDMKTSIGHLALALGKATPEQCQESDFLLPTAVWKDKLDLYFLDQQQQHGKTISPHTLRNTRNNLSFLFRTAHEHKLLSTVEPLPQVRHSYRTAEKLSADTSPYRQHWLNARAVPFCLAFEQWPPDIQTIWRSYCESRQLKTRQTTLGKYQSHLTAYIGFLITIEGRAIQWDELFDVTALDRFVRWHSQQLHVRLSARAKCIGVTLRTLASQLSHPALPAIQKYLRELPIPQPLHDKQRNSITLHELENVGLAALQDAQKPRTTLNDRIKYPGRLGAIRHSHALMLRLLVRIPLRSRNLREIQLEKNLYQDDAGHWHLHFSSEELKIGTRNGRANTYHVDLTEYCPDLLPHVEEFLNLYRRCIPNAMSSPFLFLGQFGKPYPQEQIRDQLSALVFRRIEKRFYPHLIRTIWATEYITKTGDFATAAHMLGDTVQTVLQQYHEIIEREHKDKAKNFLTAALR